MTRWKGAGRRASTCGALSHGEKQWLEMDAAGQEPKLLLMDEPVAGMTRRERERTGELLQSIGNARSVLVVEHDMEFVRQFAETVTVLHLGKVLSEGTMETVQQDPEVIRAYLGHGASGNRTVAESDPRSARAGAGSRGRLSYEEPLLSRDLSVG